MTAEKIQHAVDHLRRWGARLPPPVLTLLAAYADACRERDRLYAAIRDSGYGVLQTSAGWSIHDVSERGKEEERRTAEVIAENIGLQAERDRLREACRLIVSGWGHQDGVSHAVEAARGALGEKP